MIAGQMGPADVRRRTMIGADSETMAGLKVDAALSWPSEVNVANRGFRWTYRTWGIAILSGAIYLCFVVARRRFIVGVPRIAARYLAVFIGMSCLFLSCEMATAGSVFSATVTAVSAESPNAYFIYVNVAPSGVPACATNTTALQRFAFDLTTDAGKAMIAIVLTAYVNKSPLDIVGTDSCTVWSDTETVSYLTAH